MNYGSTYIDRVNLSFNKQIYSSEKHNNSMKISIIFI